MYQEKYRLPPHKERESSLSRDQSQDYEYGYDKTFAAFNIDYWWIRKDLRDLAVKLRYSGYPCKNITGFNGIVIYMDWSRIKIRSRLHPNTIKMKVREIVGTDAKVI